MTGPRTELADARRAIADTCERMGLDAHANQLRTAFVQNSTVETRRELVAVVHMAGVVHKVAEAFHLRRPKSEDIVEVASCALELEAEAGKAIALCDRVIRERAELAANPSERPHLNPARVPGVRRAADGGDR